MTGGILTEQQALAQGGYTSVEEMMGALGIDPDSEVEWLGGCWAVREPPKVTTVMLTIKRVL